MIDFDIPEKEYKTIEDAIHSDESPVGIDAKHTHVLILHKLLAIERRLERLEAERGSGPKTSPPPS